MTFSEEWVRKFNEESELAYGNLTRSHQKIGSPEEKYFHYISPASMELSPAIAVTYVDMQELQEEVITPRKFLLKVNEPPPDPALLARLCADFTEGLLEPGELIVRQWWTAQVHKDHDTMTERIYLSARIGVRKGKPC